MRILYMIMHPKETMNAVFLTLMVVGFAFIWYLEIVPGFLFLAAGAAGLYLANREKFNAMHSRIAEQKASAGFVATGREVPVSRRFCCHCGSEVQKDDVFCASCGKRIF